MKKIVLFLLTALLALTVFASCSDKKSVEETPSTGADLNVTLPDSPEKENVILGKEENIKFTFRVTHKDGVKVQYNVETTKDNLLDALLEGSIIKLSDSVVAEVDGAKLDEEAKWSFYKDGEALSDELSSVAIAEGDSFEAVYTE